MNRYQNGPMPLPDPESTPTGPKPHSPGPAKVDVHKVGISIPVSTEVLHMYNSPGYVGFAASLLAVMGEDLEYPTANPERRAEIDEARRVRHERSERHAAEREREAAAWVNERIDELKVEHDADPPAFFRRVAEAERDWYDHCC